jgi:hypothetical protein
MGRVRRPDVPLLPGFGQIKIARFHQAEINRLVHDPFVLLVLTCKLRLLSTANDHNSLHANTGVGQRHGVDAVKIKIAQIIISTELAQRSFCVFSFLNTVCLFV